MSRADVATPDRTKMPPHNLEAEESLLGAMLLSNAAASAGIDVCAAGDFYKPAHGHIFGAVWALIERGEAIDAVTVTDELKRSGLMEAVGDPSIFVSLQANTPSISHARHYAEIVADHSRLRQVIEAGQRIAEAGYQGDVGAAGVEALRVAEVVAGRPGAPNHLRRWTMPDLLDEPSNFTWLVRGLLADPTYGQLAGEMKTLKSTVLDFIMVGLAAGVPIFGQFDPVHARPVLAYVGEGGRALWTRRIRRICAAMCVRPEAIDLHAIFDVAPIQSEAFQVSLRRGLDDVGPALVGLDPYYAFHGSETPASDLHQEGELLNALSTPCMDAGASLLAVNHFNQSGHGTSLKRITMAGGGEWADSWVLLEHRENPEVAVGTFALSMEIGSRQWGGCTWDLDLDLGRFDEETGTHDGEITWSLTRATDGSSSEKASDAKSKARRAIIDALADMPWKLTKTELMGLVGGNRSTFAAALDELVEDGRITHNKIRRNESGVDKTRPLWGLNPTPADEVGPGCAQEPK